MAGPEILDSVYDDQERRSGLRLFSTSNQALADSSPVLSAGPRGAACAGLVGLAQAATAASVLAELVVPTFPPTARQAAGSA